VKQATGIFIAGGNQMRLTTLFGGTRLETELLATYRRGTVLAGTSAGAAVLSKVMLAFGRSGPTPRQSLAQFTAGFGLTDKLLFDQHFRQRDRLGRLIYAVAAHPGLLGVGIDENTAAILEDDRLISVLGTGAVTIVDGHEISATDAAEAADHAPIAVAGLKVHVLTEGCCYDILQRQAIIPKKLSLSD
jgi:cyanophycinase